MSKQQEHPFSPPRESPPREAISSDYVPIGDHLEAMRQADMRFNEERDRRYTEVNIEKEKALKIKETADLAALSLAREIQTYKDEKANELREQINTERVHYASKDDLKALGDKMEIALKPLTEFVASARGGTSTQDRMVQFILALIIVVGTIVTLIRGFN